MKIRIGTFNMVNLFLRYRILNGDRAGPYYPKTDIDAKTGS